MTQSEATNIIIALQNEGWADDKITAFIKFIETHHPSEEEARDKYNFLEPKRSS